MNSRKLLRWLLGITSAVVLVLAGIVWSIGAGVRRSGEEAVSRFGGGRVDALAALVECGDCPMRDRNRAVWALGQLGDARVLQLLAKHYSGGRCDHARQLCQYELKKAIRLLEDQNNRMAVLWRWPVS